MVILYNGIIRLYQLAISVAGLFHPKARDWRQGRKDWDKHLQAAIRPGDRIIWVHSASAGELEQGKPLIEALKQHYPNHRILISFFSPSGYAVGKKYREADIITYLPLDTPSNAKRFIELARPEFGIFIKYEYWHHHLSEAARRNIPVLLVSAIFRKEQIFFKSWGGFYRSILKKFHHLFVQDKASLSLLQEFNITHASVSGDTRFDRVSKITEHFSPLPLIESFLQGRKAVVAGSTWPDDEKLLAYWVKGREEVLIIAPHEINESHLKSIEQLFGNDAVRFSKWSEGKVERNKVLIIDNIGMLSRLYAYGAVTYIGGGFNKSGIHNTLEAATWGKPVLFGPNYKKFREAKGLVANGAAFSITNEKELASDLNRMLDDEAAAKKSGSGAAAYVQSERGATEKILGYIQEKRLLTS